MRHLAMGVVISSVCLSILIAGLASNAQAQSWQGVMIRGSGPEVYYIDNGMKRYIPTPSIVEGLGGWGKVVLVDDGFRDSFKSGQPKTDTKPADQSVLLFNYSFKMNDAGSNHIQTMIRADHNGRVGGWFTYDNDSNLGFCGGIVVAIYDSPGTRLAQFTPPSGCINGKMGGKATKRKIDWEDQIPASALATMDRLEVRAYHTSKSENLPTMQQAIEMLKAAATVIASIQ